MQTSNPHKNERPELGVLPIVADKVNPLFKHVSKIQAILKSQLVNILSGKNVDIDEAILKELQSVHDEGYSKGMKHMDLMHEQTELL